MTKAQKDLGRLTRVDLRDIWNSEANDFTPWLGVKIFYGVNARI